MQCSTIAIIHQKINRKNKDKSRELKRHKNSLLYKKMSAQVQNTIIITKHTNEQRRKLKTRTKKMSSPIFAIAHNTTNFKDDDFKVVKEILKLRNPQVAIPAHPTHTIEMSVRTALEEDIGDVGDLSSLSTIPEETQARAQLLAKASGVLAGEWMANVIMGIVDDELEVSWKKRDGDLIEKGEVFCSMRGRARSILRAERVVLNFMQRMSGIATLTNKMAVRAKPARVLETRKTVPGLRVVDKWAVLIGGGENHRMGLFDMVMIKDNHVAAANGIANALKSSTEYLKADCEKYEKVMIELETRTMDEVEEVCALLRDKGVDTSRVQRVMLDNMSIDDMSAAAAKLNAFGVETEASGNVTLETIGGIGATGVTFISSGQLTHSVIALDISLNIENE